MNKCNNCGRYAAASECAKCTDCGDCFCRRCRKSGSVSPDWLCGACSTSSAGNETPSAPTLKKKVDIKGDAPATLQDLKEIISDMIAAFEARQNARLDEIDRQVTEIKAQNEIIKITNSDIEKSIGDVSDRIDQVQSSIKSLEANRKEIITKIAKLEDKCELLDRQLLKTSIEIRNVPKVKGETKTSQLQYIQNLGKCLEIDLQISDCRDLYRLPNKNNNITSSIILELSSTVTKARILDGIKTRFKNKSPHLCAADLGFANVKSEIFVSDYLTPKGRRLLYLAKALKIDAGFKYCWTSGGNVFLKKHDNEMAILVKSEEHIDRLKGQYNEVKS